MNMTITQRDRRLAVFIPAILVVCGYFLWARFTGKFTALTRAEAEMAKVEAAAPSEDALLHQQLHVSQATQRTNAAAVTATEARERFLGTTAFADPSHRAARIHKLTTLLSEQGLVVIEHTDADAGKDRVPPSLDAFAKKLPNPPKLHRIKFLSRYLDACQLTAALSRDTSVALPVGLTMKESGTDTDWHEWTLLVWV